MAQSATSPRRPGGELPGRGRVVTGVRLRPAAAADLAAIARIWREGWADGHEGNVPAALVAERTPASFDQRALERVGQTWVAYQAQTATGTVAVPAHRYEREVGNR
ncbi:MAG TPA: hypothetical protein VF468_13925 [Actinomycetota bacterium]|nr:hypothetical protein [Actinomycetota bacterium]